MNEEYKHLNYVLHDSNGSLDRVTELSGVVSVVVVTVAAAVVLGVTRYKVHGRSSDVEQGLEHRGPGMVFFRTHYSFRSLWLCAVPVGMPCNKPF